MYLRNWFKDLLVQITEKKVKNKKASILMYHSVGNNKHFFTVSQENFLWQINYLVRQNYNVIPLGQLVRNIIHKQLIQNKTIAITFDDGYADNYFIVFPIIKKYKIPVTIFLVTDLVGRKQDVRGVPMEYLTWDQIKEMSQSGLVEFGAHSKSHRKLSQLSVEEIQNELKESKSLIEQNLNKDCSLFAYPFGDYNSEVMGLIRNNFIGAASVNRGFVDVNDDIFILPRQSIDSRVDNRRFKLKV